MLWLLVKKQILETFKGYFYDAKKNKMRSPFSIAMWVVFFILIMVGVLGGMFLMLSLSLCEPLTGAGIGWLYFLMMNIIAIVLGAFGSVFNTYASLYLAKDNDLLLSMPIPARTIVTARLLSVYLMGTMYATTVLVPEIIVYWVIAGATPVSVICSILMYLIVTVIVLLLSCVLGWVVAKISLKLKNKSFITVLLTLLFIGAYYFFYFKANDFIREILNNAEDYGDRIKGAAYGLYLFGRIGEGDIIATLIFTVITALISAAVWRLLTRSFIQIATASGNTEKIRYVEKKAKAQKPFTALLLKEFSRFTSSPSYILNCGLGIFLMPAFGVLMLVMGPEIMEVMEDLFASRPGGTTILICTFLCTLTAMIDTASPSVSLEGKCIWIPQSMPVKPQTVLRAKMCLQLILSEIPMLFAVICCVIAVGTSPAESLLLMVVPLIYTAFSAIFNTCIAIRMPILNWTSEIAPIKQSGAVVVTMFGGWGICVVLFALYMIVGYNIGAVPYLLIWAILLTVIMIVLQKWLDTKGAENFAAL